MSLAYKNEGDEVLKSSLLRAEDLLGGWKPDIRQYPNESDRMVNMQNGFLELAAPEEFLAELLDFFPNINEEEVTKYFKQGLKKIRSVSENNDPQNTIEELSKTLARMILGHSVHKDPSSHLYKEISAPESHKNKLKALTRAINKALAARTYNYEYAKSDNDRISAQIRAAVYGQDDSRKITPQWTGKYLRELIADERSEDAPQEVIEKAQVLLAKLEKIQEKNKMYNPHLFLMEKPNKKKGEKTAFTQDEILDLIEDQINYLDEFSDRNEKRMSELKKAESQKITDDTRKQIRDAGPLSASEESAKPRRLTAQDNWWLQ